MGRFGDWQKGAMRESRRYDVDYEVLKQQDSILLPVWEQRFITVVALSRDRAAAKAALRLRQTGRHYHIVRVGNGY